MHSKRIYSTGLKIKFKLGVLSNDIKLQVHRNTRYYWTHHFDLNNVFGIDDFDKDEDNIKLIKTIYENERLKKMVLTLSKTYLVLISIIRALEHKKHLVYQNHKHIVNIIDEFKDYFGVKRLSKLFDITPKRYFTWKYMQDCIHPLKELCKRVNPNQLSFSEQSVIKVNFYNAEYEYWGVSNIYYQLYQDGLVQMSLQSFRNYTNKFFPKKKLPKSTKNKHKIGIRATKPFEKLHMDVTLYRLLDNSIAYIYFIVDNYSRKILSYQVSTQIKADISLKNLEIACNENNLFDNDTELIVDGGSENKGSVNEFILSRKNWTKLIAKKDIIFSNSMVEAVNKIMKYQYLFKRRLFNIKDLENYLPKAIDDYNNRPHSTIKVSPNNAAKGITFNNELYREKLHVARQTRLKANLECNLCSM